MSDQTISPKQIIIGKPTTAEGKGIIATSLGLDCRQKRRMRIDPEQLELILADYGARKWFEERTGSKFWIVKKGSEGKKVHYIYFKGTKDSC